MPNETLNVSPDRVGVIIDGQSYPVVGMSEKPGQVWMELRMMAHWRQIVLFRQINSKILGAIHTDADKRSDIDGDIANLTREWITINNHLVVQALGFDLENLTEEAVNLVTGLSEPEKAKIIILQDKMNGLDILKKLAEVSNDIAKAQPMITAAAKDEVIKEERESMARRVAMMSKKKPSKKFKKKQNKAIKV